MNDTLSPNRKKKMLHIVRCCYQVMIPTDSED